MRITHRMVADRVNLNLQHSLKRLEHYSNQLSTGKKFHRPSDDPVGVGRVMSYASAVDRNEQFRLNMNQARNWLENTELALQNGLDVLQRARELAVYGANESLTAEDRRAIAPEMLELIDHFIGIANTETNGLYIFGGHQTLTTPFNREKVYALQFNGGDINAEEPIEAQGLQNGDYRLSQDLFTAASPQPGSITVSQSCLRGSAISILGLEINEGSVSASDPLQVSASIMIEAKDADPVSGQVEYFYTAHEYALDGQHETREGIFTLTFGGADPQQIVIGSQTLSINGLGQLKPSTAAGFTAGDRAVLNITPDLIEGASYEQVSLAGEHRGGESGFTYLFNAGTIDSTPDFKIDYRYYSLNTYGRSPDRGLVHDSSLKVSYDGFSGGDDVLSFSYDRGGFPVYRGDSNDRSQEISPHQEMIMNLHGEKAFGEKQEVFEALFEVYRALFDNDRETLGNSALAKIDQSVDRFLERLAEVGARSNRVEVMQNTLDSENLYLREVRSNIEDIDLANVITEFTMQENAYRAALSTAAMMLQPSLVDYLR